MSDTRVFTVDKFLGLNESADGTSELKMGEATKCENFYITDGYNLKTRPGIVAYIDDPDYWPDRVFPFTINGEVWIIMIQDFETQSDVAFFKNGELAFTFAEPGLLVRQVFLHNGKVHLVCATGNTATGEFGEVSVQYLDYRGEGKNEFGRMFGEVYVPLILSGRAPSGADSTTIEPLNILTNECRIQFVSDGETKEYLFPTSVSEVLNFDSEDGVFNAETHTFTFADGKVPESGLDVEFYCTIDDPDLEKAKNKFLNMLNYEHYNGATDSRIFFYGDGSNICYYTGVPAHGNENALYIPAMNELAVDFSDSPITAMVRHYSRLLAFKPDGVESIVYEPVTLEDGKVIAGFYLRPVNREYGNEAMGQVVLVNNYPRSLYKGNIYDWKITSTTYRDERYAKSISQKVAKTLARVDVSKIVACDDDANKTYYAFLNDGSGTVLVHRYDLDVWSIYRSEHTKNVHYAFMVSGMLLFGRNGKVLRFDAESTYDCPYKYRGDVLPIESVWESGFMDFNADMRRKYSSNIWVSLLPEQRSWLEVTVKTDKRSEYLSKIISNALAGFDSMDFGNFSFQTYSAPKIRRIKLKVKKFVYYKLIMRVTKPGASATILGYDQQVRYSSNVK